jgi:nicotinate-nucleotide adenylyltransferase
LGLSKRLLRGDHAPGLRVGVYGGAFDPPHLDHLAMAQTFVAHLGLQRLVVVPTGQAWHKAGNLSPAEHRLAMAHAAFAPGHFPASCEVVVDDREIRHPGPSYTHHTLDALQAEAPSAHWALLMGQDQFDRFTTWHRWQHIAQVATLVVAERPIYASVRGTSALESAAPPLSDPAGGAVFLPAPCALPWEGLGLSSTHIRAHVATHGTEGLQAMVLPAIARYISVHQLYSLHT